MLVGDGVEDLVDRGAETDTPLTEQERKHGGRENVSFNSKRMCKLNMSLNLFAGFPLSTRGRSASYSRSILLTFW